jgi:hypothetical protein
MCYAVPLLPPPLLTLPADVTWPPGPLAPARHLLPSPPPRPAALMPIDALKTSMQVDGKHGLHNLRLKMQTAGPKVLFAGSMASAGATLMGHYPWVRPHSSRVWWAHTTRMFAHSRVCGRARGRPRPGVMPGLLGGGGRRPATPPTPWPTLTTSPRCTLGVSFCVWVCACVCASLRRSTTCQPPCPVPPRTTSTTAC